MTAPFPTHKQEEWRYADLDALKPVWEQFAEPVTLTVAPGENLEEVWLPVADDVQLRRVQLALGEGAKARIFALNTAPAAGVEAEHEGKSGPSSLPAHAPKKPGAGGTKEAIGRHA